jgi:hypothetical protein
MMKLGVETMDSDDLGGAGSVIASCAALPAACVRPEQNQSGDGLRHGASGRLLGIAAGEPLVFVTPAVAVRIGAFRQVRGIGHMLLTENNAVMQSYISRRRHVK